MIDNLTDVFLFLSIKIKFLNINLNFKINLKNKSPCVTVENYRDWFLLNHCWP